MTYEKERDMRVLALKKGVLYGPVNSRRLGPSLGINLLPGTYKLCTFNCLYCHYGWTKVHTRDATKYSSDLPSVGQVKEALESWLDENQTRIEYITFSGNGEPCLHPQFDEMVGAVHEAKDKFVPHSRVAILSNSTCLDSEKVMTGLNSIDVKIMKLDGGTRETFGVINRPCPKVEFERVVENLKRLDGFVLQSVFVDGSASNSGEEEVEKWIEKLCYMKPKEVQIYSIDRPSADQGLALVEKDRLRQIARLAEEACGIPVKAF
jgi:wyosine [tRNA(Phe)-imidazoG37] synthetase (radical SAM superfamily)